tara:strand:- start:475 stop:726 length:252 start_codon:yes stop_codon:yes gene_type:complete
MKDIENGILFFSASWCAPCKEIKKYLTPEIMKELNIISVDISDDIDLATKYFVSSVPTFIKIKNGTKEKMYSGRLTLEQLKTF